MEKIRYFFSKIDNNFNKFNVILSAIILLGIAFGAILAGNMNTDVLKKFNFFFFSDFEIKSSLNFISNFMSSLGASSIFFATVFFMSFSIFGLVIIFLFVLLKGVGLGVILGRLYVAYSIKGAIFGSCVLLPGAFFSVISLILCASESIEFNLILTKKVISFNEQNLMPAFLNYIKKVGTSGFVLIISAVVDSIFSLTLIKFFNFN
ncbi:MAG: hypothetical protein LBK29_03295 [Oscillospiraceae bacterium]|jgi:hypothetical protein|nr:hypothetical protein [Oscillospiraceae bacterium]